MKKLTINLILVLFASILLVACQKETSSVDLVEQQRLSVKDVFLKNYYQTSYTYGRSMDFEAEDRQMHLDEVFSSGKRAKGYLVTDKVSGELLYFVNYDLMNSIIRVIDFGDNNNNREFSLQESSNNARKIPGTDDDLLASVDWLSTDQSRKFIGWVCVGPYWDFEKEQYYEHCCYYLFWIEVTCRNNYW